ncbi:NADH-dependent flavin oxidoreductase [Pestalotiopsis sp. IQ-011]
MDSNSKNAMTADVRRGPFCDITSRSGSWNTGSPASTAMKTPSRAGTKSSKAIADNSAAADLSDQSPSKKRPAVTTPLKKTGRLEAIPDTPYPEFPSPPHKRQRSMSDSPRATYLPQSSPPHKRQRSMSNTPRAPDQLPVYDKMDAMLVVGRETYTCFGMPHKGQPIYVSAEAIARVSPALMREIDDRYLSDEELHDGGTVTRSVTLPTGKPVWYLPNGNARDMKVILDLIHGRESAVVESLRLVADSNERIPKAWRVARLAEKYEIAYQLQYYVHLWFNALKQNLNGQERMELLRIHSFLSRAAMKEKHKAPANRWGITHPETRSSSQQQLEHSSEPEDEPRDLADIHAENVRKAAAEASETTLSQQDNLTFRPRRRDARTDHY